MISSAQLGERIANARKHSSLTQAALAEKLGVARTTVVAMEKGERRPTSEELVRLAEALSVDVNDLLREHVVTAQVSPRFRSAPRGTDGIDAVVTRLKELAQQYAELEQILGVARSPAPLEAITTFRSMSLGRGVSPHIAGQDVAGFLRRFLGLGDGPAFSLQSRLELEAGLRIFAFKMPASVSAVLIWSDQVGACVALNRDHPGERQRWSLIHELGHFLRDREAGDVLPFNVDQRDPSETFCEALAAEFLMPASGLRRRFSEHLRDKGEQRFSAADLLALARFYDVSLRAMTLRLEDLQLLPKGTYDRLRKRRFKPKEAANALGLDTASEVVRDELPQRYQRLAFEAFAQALISEGELARFLHTDRIRARREYLNWTTQVDENGKLEVDIREPVLAEASQE